MKKEYSPNRKKIRGFKRRVREILKWKEKHRHFPQKAFGFGNKYYIRFYIFPWYSLWNINPPIWLQKKMLEAMIEVAHEWNQYFLNKSIEFDLQIWFQQREFARTELLVTWKDAIEIYRDFFAINLQLQPPIPKPFSALPAVNSLAWQSAREISYTDIDDTGEIISYDLGTIWVGRIPK